MPRTYVLPPSIVAGLELFSQRAFRLLHFVSLAEDVRILNISLSAANLKDEKRI
jgi:hypothetical protein